MKFDRSKVLDELSENAEQFVGKKGWFSDHLSYLKEYVESGVRNSHYGTLNIVTSGNAFTVSSNTTWALFYPDVQEVRTVEDLIKVFGRIDNVWVRDKQTGIISLVSGYNFAGNMVAIERSAWMSAGKFLEAYEVVDLDEITKELREGGEVMKVWEKMLEEEHRRFNYMRERIDEDEAKSINAMKRFIETGLCEDTGYAVRCARCPFRIECNESQIKNAARLGSEYLKERLMQEMEI